VRDANGECVVTTHKMFSSFGASTYLVGCDHNSLAVITVAPRDRAVHVSLSLEHKTVYWVWQDGRVSVTEEADPEL